MGRLQAERQVKMNLISGYEHYSRESERQQVNDMLMGKEVSLIVDPTDYPLAEQQSRSLKNNFICVIALLCRHAADLGADDKKCYALSDYYINEIENSALNIDWRELFKSVIEHFVSLVAEARGKTYPLPIQRALKYIHQNLYEKISLKDVASFSRVHPNYLSSLFKAEVGININEYMRKTKIDEAKKLLLDYDYSILEISEMLEYNSPSYFCRVFRTETGSTPKSFREKQRG